MHPSEFVLLPNETERQFLWRIGEAKTSGLLEGGWEEIAAVMNRLFRKDESEYRNEAAYRKPYQSSKAFFEDVFTNLVNDALYKPSAEELDELERARVKLHDERMALSRRYREEGRVDQQLEYLATVLRDSGREEFPAVTTSRSSDGGGIERIIMAILSDLHIGAEFDNPFGRYSSEIAKTRLGEYLNQILTIKEKEGARVCYVPLLGDLISGNIHYVLALTNRENVIDQTKLAVIYVSWFVATLAKHFDEVVVVGVSGNHSRIEPKKDQSFNKERLDSLILWMVGEKLSHLQNVSVLTSPLDETVECTTIAGKPYWFVHGDFDSFSQASANNLARMIGAFPYAVVSAHWHTFSTEWGAIRLISGGSLCGTGDQHTISKRLKGDPSQTVAVCTAKGIEVIYPITFSA